MADTRDDGEVVGKYINNNTPPRPKNKSLMGKSNGDYTPIFPKNLKETLYITIAPDNCPIEKAKEFDFIGIAEAYEWIKTYSETVVNNYGIIIQLGEGTFTFRKSEILSKGIETFYSIINPHYLYLIANNIIINGAGSDKTKLQFDKDVMFLNVRSGLIFKNIKVSSLVEDRTLFMGIIGSYLLINESVTDIQDDVIFENVGIGASVGGILQISGSLTIEGTRPMFHIGAEYDGLVTASGKMHWDGLTLKLTANQGGRIRMGNIDGTKDINTNLPPIPGLVKRDGSVIESYNDYCGLTYQNSVGGTNRRPSNPGRGYSYYDTDLDLPIWCKTVATADSGAVWIDATGAEV